MLRTFYATLFVFTSLIGAAQNTPPRSERIESGRREENINPDAAMGRTFHVSAKQWDGTKRCYLVVVGKVVEQGPVNKKSNKECQVAYRREIGLGQYIRTTGGHTPKQAYTDGDSKFCGKAKRSTTLTMVRRDQDDITASVQEPRRCVYEVTLYGSVFLLTGGGAEDPLLDGGGDPRLDAGGSAPHLTGRFGDAPAARPAASSGAQAGKRKQSSKKPQTHWERIKQKAEGIVHSTSRDVLLAKPAKALQGLLKDLGASCKSCFEKGQLVDKLLDVAGVRSEL